MITQRIVPNPLLSKFPENNNLSVDPLHMPENYPKCQQMNRNVIRMTSINMKWWQKNIVTNGFVSVNVSTSPWNYRLIEFRSWYIKIVSMFTDHSTISSIRSLFTIRIVRWFFKTRSGPKRPFTSIYWKSELQKNWKYF